ncbi:MAG: hypothetical protein RLZZ338_1037 [Cyanobacteriota bacterium]|jgi:hypothetical protein
MALLLSTSLPSLGVGYVVKVGYTASNGAVIALNLKAGNNISLHVNPRFNEGTVVLNSNINGGWGQEERPAGFPLVVGQQISIMVIVGPTEFEIQGIEEGTGKAPWVYKYKHRLPADSLDIIEFHGENLAMKDFFVQEAFTIGAAPSPSSKFKTGDTISLKADNGKYLSRINRGSVDPIEAAKSVVDPYSKFVVTVLADGKIALKADNGKYLSRINRGSIDAIEAAKDSIDPYSQFTFTVLADGKIVLKADNDKYLSRINRGSIDSIEAAKNPSDVYCQFVVS